MTVAPGLMDTQMLAGVDEAHIARLTALHVFPERLGRAEDFARLVRAIAENRMLNGEVIRLDAATRLI